MGSPSTVVEDLTIYMNTLYKLRESYSFDYICPAHSISLAKEDLPDSLIMKGSEKL